MELGSPIRANFEITQACPLACKHCYAYWGYAATGHRVSVADEPYDLEHFTQILDVLINRGIRVITFTGGEPLARKDILFPLAERAKQAGLIVFVNTSAALLTEADLDKFCSLNLDGFLVSLMSFDEAVNNELSQSSSYKKTIEGISSLAAHGQNVNVNMVCSKRNYSHVKETAQLAASLGAKSFAASPMMPALSFPDYLAMRLTVDELKQVLSDLLWVRQHVPIVATTLESLPYCAFSREEIDDFRPLLSHSYCCAGMSDCAISASGDLRPCIMSETVAGNVLTSDWDVVWGNLSEWRKASFLPSECQQCSVVDECGGGCRVAANTIHGSYSANDPYMKGPLGFQLENMVDGSPLGNHPIPVDAPLLIAKSVSSRVEPFGGAIFIDNKCLFLNPGPFDLFSSLQTSECFTINEAASRYNCDMSDFAAFAQVLFDEGIIRPAEERNGVECST